MVERRSTGNLKRTLVDHGRQTNWYNAKEAEGGIFLHHAVEIKNIWIPYGE
jgi:aldehyde dehydrogenase (NAD+)